MAKDDWSVQVVSYALAALAVLVFIVIAIPLSLWHAFAIQVLWGWYVTPIFHIPTPNLFAVAGLWLIPNSLTANTMRSWENKEGKDKFVAVATVWLLGPPVLIFAGWIYRFWARV